MNTPATVDEEDLARRMAAAKTRLREARSALSRAETRKLEVWTRWYPALVLGGTGLGLLTLGMLLSRL